MNTTQQTWYERHEAGRRRDRRRGMLAGMVAALVMLAVIVLLRRLTGVTSLIDAMADTLLLALPLSLFSEIMSTFGAQAKTLLLAGLIVLLVLVGGLIGRAFARQTAGSRRFQASRAVMTALLVFAFTAGFTYLFLRSQVPGEATGQAFMKVLACLGAASLTFGVTLALATMAQRRLDPAPDAPEEPGDAPANPGRRRLLTVGAMGIAALAGTGVLAADVTRVARRKIVGAANTGRLPSLFTSNDDFYTISKNFLDPSPDRGADWSVELGGHVTNPLTITRADLEAIQAPDFVSTLTCISNPLGGDLIGTATWTGAPMRTVLERAGIGSGAVKLIMEGEDGYTDSIPIERAMRPEVMLVWKMNGEPLPKAHGMPVRVIVPGLYGIKNIKWLTKLTVTTEDYQGYWQERQWTDDATIKTSSVIKEPGKRGVLSAGPTEIRGYAFAGDRGISKVEVSTDDGETWEEARVFESPSANGFAWVFWSLPWVPTEGTYTLKCRATDGEGNLQTDEKADELPDGASGWYSLQVGVA